MTKHIVSLGAILAVLALPLNVHAQPTRGTAGAGAATGTERGQWLEHRRELVEPFFRQTRARRFTNT